MPADIDDIETRLRNLRPSWESFSFPQSSVDETNIRRWDKPEVTTLTTPTTAAASTSTSPTLDTPTATNTNEYSFALEVDNINADAGTVRIHVGYGEINDTPPTGMTGADDYFLTISADGTEIWAVVTYDKTTLDITSRSLNFGASVPDSIAGILYVPIGFVDIAYDTTTGKITEANPHNRHCGDIDIQFVYGAENAAPALFYLVKLASSTPLS